LLVAVSAANQPLFLASYRCSRLQPIGTSNFPLPFSPSPFSFLFSPIFDLPLPPPLIAVDLLTTGSDQSEPISGGGGGQKQQKKGDQQGGPAAGHCPDPVFTSSVRLLLCLDTNREKTN
jgi:hypothetical protein